jgi:hypothetical protein
MPSVLTHAIGNAPLGLVFAVQKLPYRKAGWSWGCVSTVDSQGRTIWIADAHRDDGKRLVVRADEKVTAFSGTGSGHNTVDGHDGSGWFSGQASFAQQNTKKAEHETTITLSKLSRKQLCTIWFYWRSYQ